ncbi:MAG TPA: IS607 family transposase [Ktedonobacteraceae bacterium]|jgi:predicted site-specific integrase-resolvase
MKLSQYAKKMGISYKTAWRWYRAGQLDAYQTSTGTVIVRDSQEEKPTTGRVALYARVSSADQKTDLGCQLERLREYALAHGYQVAKEVSEIASGLNDHRPKLTKLLGDTSIGIIVIEHRDRLTRFGFNYIDQLLAVQGRTLEVIFPSDTDNDLVDDFVALITSLAARIYGRSNSKRRAEQVKKCIECAMQEEINDEESTRVQD